MRDSSGSWPEGHDSLPHRPPFAGIRPTSVVALSRPSGALGSPPSPSSDPFVDTSVWVYAVDEADLEKQAHAKRTLSAAAGGIVVSPQVMGEFYVTVTRKLATPLPPDTALDFVRDMMRQSVVRLDSKLVEAAIVGAAAWRVSYWDALLVVAARTAGADRLISEDLQEGLVMDGVTVVNPFHTTDTEAGTR